MPNIRKVFIDVWIEDGEIESDLRGPGEYVWRRSVRVSISKLRMREAKEFQRGDEVVGSLRNGMADRGGLSIFRKSGEEKGRFGKKGAIRESDIGPNRKWEECGISGKNDERGRPHTERLPPNAKFGGIIISSSGNRNGAAVRYQVAFVFGI